MKIDAIFFDLDGTLVRSKLLDPKKPTPKLFRDSRIINTFKYNLHTILNQDAHEAIRLAITRVGSANVGICTMASTRYAVDIIEKFGLGLTISNIISGFELLYSNEIPDRVRYRNVVLVDDLPIEDNPVKCEYLNITNPKYYLQVEEFRGTPTKNNLVSNLARALDSI